MENRRSFKQSSFQSRATDRFKKQWHKKKLRHQKAGSSLGIAEREKTATMREYRKMLKTKRKNIISEMRKDPSDEPSESSKQEITKLTKKLKLTAFQRAQEERRLKKEAAEERRQENERIKQEKEDALEHYRQAKAEKLRILRQKTRKGQPVMKGRIELLLQQIQREVNGPKRGKPTRVKNEDDDDEESEHL